MIKIAKIVKRQVTLTGEEREKFILGSLPIFKTEAYKKILQDYEKEKRNLTENNFLINEKSSKQPYFHEKSIAWRYEILSERTLSEKEVETIMKNVDAAVEDIHEEVEKITKAFQEHVTPLIKKAYEKFNPEAKIERLQREN